MKIEHMCLVFGLIVLIINLIQCTGTVLKGDKKGGYFAANSNVFKAVLVAFDFEVTVTVATHNVPAVNPVSVNGLLAAEDGLFGEVNTTVLSNFFLTVTSIVTPSLGNVDVILAFIRSEVPITGNTVE